MKKKIFGIALIAIMALAAGWNFTQSKNEVKLSELALANVDALAEGESSIPTIPCVTGGPSCSYVVKDANGNYYNASTSGMKNN